MRHRSLAREEAIEEYLIYRKRMRELLDKAQIARDIKAHTYKPTDFSGQGPERFAEVVGRVLVGLFADLLDPQNHALNAFDVWVVLFPQKVNTINQVWDKVKGHVQLIRDYRNDVACHANKGLRRYVNTIVKFQDARDQILQAMQSVTELAAELMREEAASLPNLRHDVDPIIRKYFANLDFEQTECLKDYFLQAGPGA
jgi:hypothetical protein